ncbi:Similar to ECT2: Protein ECT2 (Homo sapiens) [Cotesia congregata]|uniref:Similar to ECT2: Protein ECT2 (Homo sapiens) n=1 Tax=Cotesia congregata TaxID=51543 RepID=A0A8J2HH07_COTCN|nr:Similar to ECT2: Protein ECT2 (Homo sapiens) [Cotesia congregata]
MEERSVHSSISDINSEEPAKTEPINLPRKKRICLVGLASTDPALGTAAQKFGVPVLKSETGAEYIDDTTYCTYFVLKHFEGSEYEILHKSPHRILGPTALLQLADKKESLPSINRPMYSRSMLGTVVVFTGFRKKDELTRLINMIHSMGGSIRKEMGAKVTHLIANCCGGDKYRYAVTFRVPIMSMNWVVALWDAKNDATRYGNNDDVINHFKLKPFFGARVCFFGFPEDEKRHMCEVLQQQGGEPTEIDDPECSHVIIDINRDYLIEDYHLKLQKKLSSYSDENSPPSHNKTFTYYDSQSFKLHSIGPNDDDCESINSRINSVSSLMTLDSVNFDKYPANIITNSINDISCQDSPISLDFNSRSDSPGFVDELDFQSESIRASSPSKSPSLAYRVKNSPSLINNRKLIASDLRTTQSIRRYVKWKKFKSCFSLPQMTMNQSRFSKTQSFNGSFKKYPEENLTIEDKAKTFHVNRQFSLQTHYHYNKYNYRRNSLLTSLQDITLGPSFKHTMHINNNICNDLNLNTGTYKVNLIKNKRSLSCGSLSMEIKKNKLSSSASNLFEHSEGCNFIDNIPDDCNTDSLREKYNKQEDRLFRMVVDESNVNTLPDLASVRAYIVKAEWFWTSVQNEGAADEKEYLFEDYLESMLSPNASIRKDSQQAATPTTASTRRKRKRLAETLSSLVQNGADSPAVHKRRSSISDAGHLSVSGSFLDCTASPDKQMLDDIPEVEAVNTETARKNLSPRHQVFLELVQTESNYVGILSTIMTLFKSPLEDYIETSNELLNSTEAKIIFGNFPPIYEVHKKMLEELRYSAAHWTEDISIGNIFLKYAPDLMKAYPPYVNFFENTKEMLEQCDQNKPRFHAFLKICQTKPECGRQSLKELMIKPVQRLPSISLLLTDILKHTNKNNPDHSALELSISSIKEVMTYINEDKRKTEGQLAMFDIFNEIDNCPPHLVSSHRSFIGKCEVMELSEGLSGRGDHLVLFLFTDTLEICKKRSKAFNSLKSPNTVNGLHAVKLNQGKPYKHIKLLSLSTIKKVVDIRETDECQNVFALMVRNNQELKEKLYSFTITDEEVNKCNYLRTLCRQMANTVCKADADTFLISLDSHQLEIDTSDVALGTLSKAFKFASRTRMKVGRAFSFNKTPSKLKRAMSTMMSPFGSTNSLTPASQQLAQMRLASCNNINELGNGGTDSPSRDEVLVAPMSVQPTRKAKCSSLSMASLRRNCSEETIQEKTNV